MANTFYALQIHFIWSVKDRQPTLSTDLQERLWPYMGARARETDIHPIKIGGHFDHVHALVGIKPSMSVSEAARLMKSNSSKWIHDTFPELKSFAWQTGYAAFSVSKSQAGKVTDYIINQKEHHRVKTFEEEYREFLERHEVDYDEEYLLG